jgi:hypothetical protein
MTMPQADEPARPRILDTLIAGQAPKLRGMPAWPLAWSPQFPLFDGRFQGPRDITLFHETPGGRDTVFE